MPKTEKDPAAVGAGRVWSGSFEDTVLLPPKTTCTHPALQTIIVDGIHAADEILRDGGGDA